MRGSFRDRDRTEYIIVHPSKTTPSEDIGAQEIRREDWRRGKLDIGYHYVIRRDGTVEDGRFQTARGCHLRGYNHISVGICLAGGVDEEGEPADNFTADQREALTTLVRDLKDRYPGAEPVAAAFLNPKTRTKKRAAPDVLDWMEGLAAAA